MVIKKIYIKIFGRAKIKVEVGKFLRFINRGYATRILVITKPCIL